MTAARLIGLFGLTLTLAAASLVAPAQKTAPAEKAEPALKAEPAFEPSVGQKGKDVVWVPTAQDLVDKMLDMAKATPRDYVMDLGSGDGRTVITAAKRGIRALGVEYDPRMVELSRRNAAKEGVTSLAKFVKADLFETDFSKATVITMFLLPEINVKLRPRILALRPGTRIVSNTFGMGEWEADEKAFMDSASGCDGYCTVLLWIVPANVAGTHKTAQGELTLEQTFQKVKGTLRNEGKAIPVEGKVIGDEVVLAAEGRELRGKVRGRRLTLG
jgi:SAM-dependent methyltransferase